MPLRILRRFWRFLTLVLASASKLAILSLVLLNFALAGLTVTVLLSDRLFGFLSSIIEGVADGSTVSSRHKDQLDVERKKVTRLETDLDAERQRTAPLKADLEKTRSDLEKTRSDLDTERQRAARLETDLDSERQKATKLGADLDAERKNIRDLKVANTAKYHEVAGRFRSRGQRMAAANIASTFAESIPIYGVAMILAATAYEMTETCAMMRDMDELASLFDVQPVDETTNKVCGMEVPSTEEVWDTMIEAPGSIWEQARQYFPDEVPPPPSLNWDWFWYLIDWIKSQLPGA